MTLSTDFSVFSDKVQGHFAFSLFRRALEGRAFGGEALFDAWEWFRTGWEMRDRDSAYGSSA